jgi:predicted N-formylglutamate amidohydrolase
VKRKIIITCEHGGNHIPRAYRRFFKESVTLLGSHRGYDAGALGLARRLVSEIEAELYLSSVSRLLVDLNRSPGSRNLFSHITRGMDLVTKKKILNDYYFPYRNGVESVVAHAVKKNMQVLHVSVHSFTPVLDGSERTADVGLLYDPSRTGEKNFCARWRDEILSQCPDLVVRSNYPYRGTTDGMTSYLRKKHDGDLYRGIELEMNQKHLVNASRFNNDVTRGVVRSLCSVLCGARR